MSITKSYEITCDICGCGNHYFSGSIQSAEEEFIVDGGIIITHKGKRKHYDTEGCYEKET